MLAAVLFALCCARAPDLAAALAGLRADAAAERAAARNWIARHAGPGDYDALRAAALAGDAELRFALALALADADVHFESAARLSAESEPALGELGTLALEGALARWQPELLEPPARGLELEELLQRYRERFRSVGLRLDARLPLELALERWARVDPPPVAVAIDPDALAALERAPAPAPRAAPRAAPLGEPALRWDELLLALVERARGFELQGPRRFPAWGEALQPALVLVPAAPALRAPRASASAAAMPLGRRMLGWARELASDGPAERRTACALALGATQWPAAVAWLGWRWSARRDEAALAGAVLAAERGACAPALAEAEALRAWLRRAEQQYASGGAAGVALGEHALRALRQLGPLDSAGVDIGGALAQGFDALGARAQLFRLSAAERARSADPALRALVDARLASADAPVEVLFACLRCASGAPEPAAERPAELALALAPAAVDLAQALELGAGLARARAAALDEDQAARFASSGRCAREALIHWRLARGEAAAAARALRELAPPAAQALFAEWVARGERELALALDAALRAEAPPSAELERAELLAGLLPSEQHAEWAARAAQASDAAALAALVAGPAADAAERALAGLLAARLEAPREPGAKPGLQPGDEALLAALRSALARLYAAGLDGRALAWGDRCQDLLREHAADPLARRVLRAEAPDLGWPQLPPAEERDLDALDWRPWSP